MGGQTTLRWDFGAWIWAFPQPPDWAPLPGVLGGRYYQTVMGTAATKSKPASPPAVQPPALAAAAQSPRRRWKWGDTLRWNAWSISLAVHVLFCLLLWTRAFETLVPGETPPTLVTAGESIVEGFETLPGDTFDFAAGTIGADVAAAPEVEVSQAESNLEAFSSELDAEIATLMGVNNGLSTEGDGSGLGAFAPAAGTKVVTKGSFSAWTVPADPRPREWYSIIIVVKLPAGTEKYRTNDLSGMVVGTDKYRQALPGPRYAGANSMLPIKDRMVQFVIPVPGGEQLVQDTIKVRSKLLKEEQTLEIEF